MVVLPSEEEEVAFSDLNVFLIFWENFFTNFLIEWLSKIEIFLRLSKIEIFLD